MKWDPLLLHLTAAAQRVDLAEAARPLVPRHLADAKVPIERPDRIGRSPDLLLLLKLLVLLLLLLVVHHLLLLLLLLELHPRQVVRRHPVLLRRRRRARCQLLLLLNGLSLPVQPVQMVGD